MQRYVISISHDESADGVLDIIKHRSAAQFVNDIDPVGEYRQIIAELDGEMVNGIGNLDEVRYVHRDTDDAMQLGTPVPSEEIRSMAQSPSWGFSRVNAAEAHAVATGNGKSVAVVDTGIDDDHSDLEYSLGDGKAAVSCGNQSDGDACDSTAGNECNEPWSDDGGHGTWCAGAIAAAANDRGVIGLSPNATVHSYKGLDCRGRGRYGDIASMVTEACDDGHDVISLSLGGPESPIIKDAVDYAANNGSIVVAAAGNSGSGLIAPAVYSSCIAVGATNASDDVADFSCRGPELTVVAPGVRLRSTTPGGYGAMSGTSMATPIVAGGIASMLSAGVDPGEARSRVTSTATDIGVTEDVQGAGLFNAEAAMPEPDVPEQPSFEWPDFSDVLEWIDGVLFPNSDDYTRTLDHVPETDVEGALYEHLVRQYGEERVERQHYYPDTQRRCDIRVEAIEADDSGPGTVLCIEAENDFDSVIGGVGQAILYSNHEENGLPLVVAPEHVLQEPETSMLREAVPIMSVRVAIE